VRNWSKQKLRKTEKSRSYYVRDGHERLKLKLESSDKMKKDTLAISDFLGWAKFESGYRRRGVACCYGVDYRCCGDD